VRGTGGIHIDLDTANQRLEPMNKIRVYDLYPFGVAGNVAGQEAQKLPEHRVVAIVGLNARQHHLATGAD
jgi:hypothetical protein